MIDENSIPERSSGEANSSSNIISMKIAPNTVDQKTTLVTDRDVYRTYFGTIGRLNLALYFGGGLLFAFSLKFTGAPPHTKFKSVLIANHLKMYGSCGGRMI